MDEQTVESDAWAVISNLRDQHPRLPDDCPTDDIVVALAAAGLLAAPAAQPPTPREWMNARDTEPRDCGRVRDRDGVIWCRRSDGGWHAEESGKWAWQFWPAFVDRHGPLTEVLPTTEVDAFEDHASPAAPADDEAMIERMARASWYASDGFITGLPWPVTGFRAEKERRRVRGALAAYLGQPWYVGQEVEWNPTGDEWKTGFITRLSGDNAGITLHDNAQPLTVSTRNLRSALAALREGQQ